MTIYGKNPVMEALKSKKKITRIYVTNNNVSLIEPYSKQIEKINVVDAAFLTKKYGDKTQGIVAEIAEYKYASLNNVLKRV